MNVSSHKDKSNRFYEMSRAKFAEVHEVAKHPKIKFNYQVDFFIFYAVRLKSPSSNKMITQKRHSSQRETIVLTQVVMESCAVTHDAKSQTSKATMCSMRNLLVTFCLWRTSWMVLVQLCKQASTTNFELMARNELLFMEEL